MDCSISTGRHVWQYSLQADKTPLLDGTNALGALLAALGWLSKCFCHHDLLSMSLCLLIVEAREGWRAHSMRGKNILFMAPCTCSPEAAWYLFSHYSTPTFPPAVS